MDNPFLLPCDERLADWRAFRRLLADLPEPEQLARVATYWAQAPLVSRAYDIEAPATWPSIWEMIHAGEWCRNSIAIGMEATLRLAGWSASRLALRLIIDRDIAAMLLILQIDHDQMLNYDWGVVAPRPTTDCRTLRQFSWTGRGYTPPAP